MVTAQVEGVQQLDPAAVDRWIKAGECVLIDVRDPDEHARESIPGAVHKPLGTVSEGTLPHGRVVFHCKGGVRSAEAAGKCAGREVYSLSGGIDAWKRAGLPTVVNARAPKMGVMRQVQAIIGAVVLLGIALGALVHPWLYAVAAVPGAGLLMAGLTGFCPLAMLVARMPWNRGAGCAC
jgi:rhodanese-related sulfurtransferase